jgi:hypothetical protein
VGRRLRRYIAVRIASPHYLVGQFNYPSTRTAILAAERRRVLSVLLALALLLMILLLLRFMVLLLQLGRLQRERAVVMRLKSIGYMYADVSAIVAKGRAGALVGTPWRCQHVPLTLVQRPL